MLKSQLDRIYCKLCEIHGKNKDTKSLIYNTRYYEGNVYLVDTTISNKEIFEIGYGTQNQGIDDFSIEIFIIPKQSGQATMTLNFENSKNNKIEKIKNYLITINENLEVEYEEK